MLVYDQEDDNLIVACNFDKRNIHGIDPEEIFKVESKWRDRTLLYSTVQACAAAIDWKPTVSHSIYISGVHVVITLTETEVRKKDNLYQVHFVKTASGK